MANPNPPLENLRPKPWKPGQSGNPKGYSKKRRATDALAKFIDEHGLDNAIGKRWLGAALDEPAMLDTIEEVEVLDKDGFPVLDKDGKPRTKKRRYRSRPNAHFFAMLLERLEGKVPDRIIDETNADSKPPKRIDVPLRDRRKDRRKAKEGDPDGSDPT